MQYGMSKKPTSYADVLKQKQEVKPKINIFDFTAMKTQQPTQTKQMNFGLPINQANTTNFSNYKQNIPQVQTQPAQKSGLSLIPTASADFGQDYLGELEYDIKNGATSDEILKSYSEVKGNSQLVNELMYDIQNGATIDEIKQAYPELGQTQPKQEPQVTEQSFGEMGLNIAGNIYKGVENLGADAINIGSSAIGSDFRVKPLRDQLFDNKEEYKGGLSQDIANKIYKRGEKMASISENSINQTQGETSFQFGANLGAGVTDTIGEVFFSGLSTLTPDSQKEKLNNYIGEIAKTEGGEMAIKKAKELKTKYQEFKFNNPRAGRNTDAVLDTLNFITNSGVIKFGDKAINTGINKVGQGINTLKTEVKEGLDRGFSIPGKGKTVVDNTIQNTTKAKTKGGVEFDIEDRPGFTTKIFDKILSKDNEILAQQSVMPKATKEKTLKGRSQSSKTALEGIEQLYEDKAKGIIQEDIKSMPGGVNGMDEGLSYYGKKIGELTDNKAIIDTTDLVNNLEKSLNEPFSGINSSMKSVVTNIIDEFKKINYQASIGDLQNALSNIKSEIFSNAENISKLYKTNTGKALNNFLNEIDIRFNKTIENTTGNLPELLEAKKAYSKYKKIQKDFTDSLMVDIRNQGKGLTGTAGKIAGLYEVLNNPSMSGVFKAVVLKNVAEKMQYYKTRSGNYETLIRKLDKEALERFKTNNLENDINSNISRSTDTTEPIKALPPGKKEPIITPQTKENAIIQQSKSDLQKAKIGTTTPQPKLLKKSPLSDREKAIIRKEQQTAPLISGDKTPQVLETPNKDMVVPKPKVGVKIGDKRPLLKDKIGEDTNIKEEPRFRNKSGKEISKEVSDKEIEDYFYNNLPNVSKEDLKPYLENEEMRKIAKSFILQERQRGGKPYEGQFDKDFDRLPKVDGKPTLELPATRTKEKQIVEAKDDYVLAINRETYINLPPMTREKAFKIMEANKTLVKGELVNKHFDIMPKQYVEHMGYKQVEDTKGLLDNKPKPLLKKENLEKAKEMFKKDDDLIKEAKKYESADEFIKSQELVYHGTNAKFKEFDLSKTGKNFNISKGISFTNNKDFVAEKYGKNIIKAKINLNNPLIVKADLKTTKGQVQTAVSMADEQLINFNNLNKKYDGIITEDYRGDKVYIVFDPKNIKTEAQLKEIYNKANPTKKLLSKEKVVKEDINEEVIKKYNLSVKDINEISSRQIDYEKEFNFDKIQKVFEEAKADGIFQKINKEVSVGGKNIQAKIEFDNVNYRDMDFKKIYISKDNNVYGILKDGREGPVSGGDKTLEKTLKNIVSYIDKYKDKAKYEIPTNITAYLSSGKKINNIENLKTNDLHRTLEKLKSKANIQNNLNSLTKSNIDEIASKITTDTTKLAKVKEEVVKKDIEGYTQSLINKRGEYLEISKRYQNILREIENEKNLIKLKELKKQEKIIGKELNDFANNSNYKSYEAKANIQTKI